MADLFPRAEVELAFRNGHDDLAPRDLAFQARVRVVLNECGAKPGKPRKYACGNQPLTRQLSELNSPPVDLFQKQFALNRVVLKDNNPAKTRLNNPTNSYEKTPPAPHPDGHGFVR